MKSYVLDANVFIQPYRLFYPFDLAPSFWRQLHKALGSSDVILLDVVLKELKKNEDELSSWLSDIPNLIPQSTQQTDIIGFYGQVLQYLQNCGLYREEAVRQWAERDCADPWIIAYAASRDATIITFETSGHPQLGQLAKKAKIPDVAFHFNVTCENLYSFMRDKNFSL